MGYSGILYEDVVRTHGGGLFHRWALKRGVFHPLETVEGYGPLLPKQGFGVVV